MNSLVVEGSVNPALGAHFDGVLVTHDVTFSDTKDTPQLSHSFINSTVLGNMTFNCINGVYYANNIVGNEILGKQLIKVTE